MNEFTIGFLVIFVVVIFLFLRQFGLLNSRGIIFAVSAIALVFGFSIFQSYRRRKLEGDLKKREDALKEQEKQLQDLQKKYNVSKEEISKANEALKQEKAQYMKKVLAIDAEKDNKIKNVKDDLDNMTTDEIFEKFSKTVGG